MQPVLLMLSSVTAYALAMNLIQSLVKKYGAFMVLVISTPIMWVCLVGLLFLTKKSDTPLQLPEKIDLWGICLLALIFVFTNFCSFQVYRVGGTPALVAGITVLLPVLVTLIDYVSGKGIGNPWYLGSYVLAGLSVAMAIHGKAAVS